MTDDERDVKVQRSNVYLAAATKPNQNTGGMEYMSTLASIEHLNKAGAKVTTAEERNELVERWRPDGTLVTLEADIDVDTSLDYDTAALVMGVQGPSEIRNVFTIRPLVWEILYLGILSLPDGSVQWRTFSSQAFDGDTGHLIVRARSRPHGGSSLAAPSLPESTSIQPLLPHEARRLGGAWHLGRVIDTNAAPGMLTINLNITWMSVQELRRRHNAVGIGVFWTGLRPWPGYRKKSPVVIIPSPPSTPSSGSSASVDFETIVNEVAAMLALGDGLAAAIEGGWDTNLDDAEDRRVVFEQPDQIAPVDAAETLDEADLAGVREELARLDKVVCKLMPLFIAMRQGWYSATEKALDVFADLATVIGSHLLLLSQKYDIVRDSVYSDPGWVSPGVWYEQMARVVAVNDGLLSMLANS
jgi:hypothetical protein